MKELSKIYKKIEKLNKKEAAYREEIIQLYIKELQNKLGNDYFVIESYDWYDGDRQIEVYTRLPREIPDDSTTFEYEYDLIKKALPISHEISIIIPHVCSFHYLSDEEFISTKTDLISKVNPQNYNYEIINGTLLLSVYNQMSRSLRDYSAFMSNINFEGEFVVYIPHGSFGNTLIKGDYSYSRRYIMSKQNTEKTYEDIRNELIPKETDDEGN